jgi:predicted dehydrogenase
MSTKGPIMTSSAAPALRVAMIGYAFMGAAHSQAWRTAGHVADLPLRPEMAVVVGRNPESVASAAARLGWQDSDVDWRRVIARDDIDLIDICTPGDTHAEIALAALAAGKHVLCEKPLANSVAEAETMVAAAAAAPGRQAMVGFTYRRTPAVALAREMVADGTIGTVRQVRAQYLQDWLSDENAPLTWRMDKEKAGSGALGDIGAHIIDAIEFVTDQRLTGVSGRLETFVSKRPLAAEGGGGTGLGGAAGSGFGPVTVDDAAVFFGTLDSGALASFEASRFALGRKNAMRFEINGSKGSLAFDFESMNVLEHYDGRLPATGAGFTRILVTEPTHPYLSSWWPPGHGLGYEHGFTHQVIDLVRAIASDGVARPTFADGLHVQRVLAAVEASSAAGSSWQTIPDAT